MSEEEIIDKIEEEYDEKYLLIEALRNIFKGKKEEYDIQIITSQLLALYKEEKEKNASLQKEIEKYKKLANSNLSDELIFRERICPEDTFIIQENYISKDKIREKIEEYKKPKNFKEVDEYGEIIEGEIIYKDIVEVLQELLEEE